MKSEPTQEFLNRMAQEVERQLALVTSQFQNLPEEKLQQIPAPNNWNAAQCFWHLNSYCHYYLPRMEQALLKAKPTSESAFKSGWMGSYFTRLMQPVANSKKMKAIKVHTPANKTTGITEIAQFIDYQERLLALLDKSRAVNLNSVKIPTSLLQLIRLNLGDTLQFVIAHQHRHLVQAGRCVGN